MIESIFYFFILVSIAVFLFGIYAKSPMIIALSAVLFIGLGAYLLYSSEGLITDKSTSISMYKDAGRTDVNITYLTLTPQNDMLINIISNLFFYGGWIIIGISFIALYKRSQNGKDNEYEAVA